ncbi:MAG: hypothetical protein ACLRYD_12590 [Ruminococcus callidus]
MPYTGHVRKRTTKSGITTYQVIVEEESSFANGKRKRYYKTIQGGKKQAEKVMRDMIHELETRTFVKDNRITVRDFMHQWLEIYVKISSPPPLYSTTSIRRKSTSFHSLEIPVCSN